MIRYIIVDDESIAHDIIKEYCDLLPNMELVQNCYDAFEAIAYLSNHSVDLIFLDLNMPKMKGFDFLKTLSNPPKVIVTTAYKENAIEGYELNITDYLLKPFSFERFVKAINKVNVKPPTTAAAATKTLSPITEERFFFRSNKKTVQVKSRDILFIEARGNYCNIVTKEDTITVREKISDLLKLLPNERFFQIHKSFIVAKEHVREVEGNKMMVAGYTVPIGKTYKGNLEKLLRC